MTKEEKIAILKDIIDGEIIHPQVRRDVGIWAIKALEQEPCEDAVSRQSAIFLASDLKQDLPDDERIADMVMAHNEGVSEYQTQLSLLPSVNPQPKTGHWKHNKCDVCGASRPPLFDNYCPNCGVKMVEPQERSE